MKDLPKRVLFGAIVTLLLLGCTTPVFAFDTGSVGGRPAYPQKDNERSQGIFIRTIDPGATVDEGLLLVNYRDNERTVSVNAVDSSTSTDGSFSCREDVEPKKEVGTWVKLQSNKIVLASQESKIIPFTITVPKGASPGEHGGCISIQDQANLPTGSGGGVKLGFRTAIRIAITVSGDVTKEAVIKQVTISRNQSGKYVVSPIITNKGNVSLDVATHAQLQGRFGEKTPVQDTEFPVMNGQSSGWNFEFDRPFWGGWYKARVLATYNSNVNDGLGKNADKSKKTLTYMSKYFFVLPSQKGMIIEGAVLLMPILFVIWFLLWRRHRKKRAAWVVYIADNGDTIQSIAQSHSIKWKKLARANHIKSPYIIQTGQKLLVPPLPGENDRTADTKPKKPKRGLLGRRKGNSVEASQATDGPNLAPVADTPPVQAPAAVKPEPAQAQALEPIFPKMDIHSQPAVKSNPFKKPSVTSRDINSVLFSSAVSEPHLSAESKSKGGSRRSATSNNTTSAARRRPQSKKRS